MGNGHRRSASKRTRAVGAHSPRGECLDLNRADECRASGMLGIMGRGGPDIGKRSDKVAREHAPDPLAPIGTEDSGEGTVKWWDRARGYGAVSVGKIAPWDVWCGFSCIDADGYRELTPGESVQIDYYRADQDSFKYVASKVTRAR